jgi:hypothetical protein
MKKLILSAIACFAIVLSSCNQNSPTPAPATPATPTPTPTSSMTATEALLVGDWIWDKTEVYGSGNLSQIRTPATYQLLPNAPNTNNMYAGSHMVLKSSFYNGVASTSTAIPQFYNADYYTFQSYSNSWWVTTNANGAILNTMGGVGGIMSGGYITTLNTNTLICHQWVPGGIANGNKDYFHK